MYQTAVLVELLTICACNTFFTDEVLNAESGSRIVNEKFGCLTPRLRATCRSPADVPETMQNLIAGTPSGDQIDHRIPPSVDHSAGVIRTPP